VGRVGSTSHLENGIDESADRYVVQGARLCVEMRTANLELVEETLHFPHRELPAAGNGCRKAAGTITEPPGVTDET
jgi:hypothetical protein